MFPCVLAFVGIYAAVFGITLMLLNVWWPISLFGMNMAVFLPFLCGGLLLSFCALGFIRMMGEQSGEEDPRVIYLATRIAAFLGLLATVAAAAIQSYFRITYDIKSFLLHKGAWLQDVLECSEFTLDGTLLFLVLLLPVLIGVPLFVFAFYAQSFDEYVTVHYVEMGGGEVETGRSEAYLPIWPTLIIGLLLSAALIFLVLTPLAYLLIVPFAILLFGYPKKKRIITASAISGAIALVAAILAFTLSSTTAPQGIAPTEGIVYSDTGSGYCVSGYEGKDTEVVIPKKHEGKPVIAIGESAFANSAITSLTIPDSVSSIGNGAFAACESLPEIIIPASVTSIGSSAFSGCTALTEVSLPASVTSIGSSAFSGCTALTEVSLPASVTSIGSSAFFGCTALTKIRIPASVVFVGSEAFGDCPVLVISCEMAEKPDSWYNGWKGFCPVIWDCNHNNVADDGYIYTLQDEIRYVLKDGKASVARQKTSITTAKIPATVIYKGNSYPVTSIGISAFSGCTALTEVSLPASVTSIDSHAFSRCTALASINLPERLEVIGGGAFRKCCKIQELTLPNSVTSIGSYAFAECVLTITIPASVTTIGENAFWKGFPTVTIRCEAKSKPSGWSSMWNSGCPVTWGYTEK